MEIVIMDGHALNPGDVSWVPIEQFGTVRLYPHCAATEQEIIQRIGRAQIVLTNKTPISANVLRSCPEIRLVCTLSTGYNVIDIAAARELGICVCNVPAYGTQAVAQFAIGLLLEICHHTWQHSQSVHDGDWQRCPDFCYWNQPLIELAGKTIGIIGFGRIGQAVGRIAKALGMRVLATGSRPTEEGRKTAEYVDLDTLLSSSDVVSLHCPLFPETARLINRETIAKMKDGAILINNSRGALLDEQAVADALNCGKLYAAGVDVASTEPIDADNPLLTARNCIITPHISWASIECRRRIVDITAGNISAFLNGCPQNTVNS